MPKQGTSGDRVAFAILLSVPVFLLIIGFYAAWSWESDSVNNPNHPNYIPPDILANSSLSACLSPHPITSRIGEFAMTRLYMPMVSDVGYITSLGKRCEPDVSTVWGIVSKSACVQNQTSLPTPYMNVTVGSQTLTFNYTTTSSTTITGACFITHQTSGRGAFYPYRIEPETHSAHCTRGTNWPGADGNWTSKTMHHYFTESSGFKDFAVMGIAPGAPSPTKCTTKDTSVEEGLALLGMFGLLPLGRPHTQAGAPDMTSVTSAVVSGSAPASTGIAVSKAFSSTNGPPRTKQVV